MKEKIKTTKNKKSTKSTPLKGLINEKDKIIKELNKELGLLKDKNIKLLAEFDNFQRRSFNEKEASKKYQGIDIVKDLLPAFDDINRALEYENADNESIFKATQLIHSKIEKILEKYSKLDFLVGKNIVWNQGSGVVESIDVDGSLIVKSSNKIINLYSEEVHIEKY